MQAFLRFKADTRGMDMMLRHARREEKRLLDHIGGTIRKTGQRSMRPGKRGQTSLPGRPPLVFTNRYRKMIRYAYDRSTHSEVIGATSYDGRPIPGFIEHGGIQVMTGRKTGARWVGHYRPRPAMRLALEKTMTKAVPGILKDFYQK